MVERKYSREGMEEPAKIKSSCVFSRQCRCKFSREICRYQEITRDAALKFAGDLNFAGARALSGCFREGDDESLYIDKRWLVGRLVEILTVPVVTWDVELN